MTHNNRLMRRHRINVRKVTKKRRGRIFLEQNNSLQLPLVHVPKHEEILSITFKMLKRHGVKARTATKKRRQRILLEHNNSRQLPLVHLPKHKAISSMPFKIPTSSAKINTTAMITCN